MCDTKISDGRVSELLHTAAGTSYQERFTNVLEDQRERDSAVCSERLAVHVKIDNFRACVLAQGLSLRREVIAAWCTSGVVGRKASLAWVGRRLEGGLPAGCYVQS